MAGMPRSAYSVRLKNFYDWLYGLNKFKPTIETKTATTTFAADSALQFPMAANATYRFRAVVFFDTTAAADFAWKTVGPASPGLVRIAHRTIIPGATAFSNVAVDTAYSASKNSETGTGTNGGFIEFDGIITNGSTAGTFSIQWAQDTSDAGNTSVLPGSYISYERIAG